MFLPQRIFFTGVPGSKWSGIAQLLESTREVNTSDRTPAREYNHNQYSGHKGAYFGTGMEFEPDVHNTDQAWENPNDGCMIVKSHEWAYKLEEIYKERVVANNDWIMLIYRPSEVSSDWWRQAGGFNISYPNYDYYDNMLSMNEHIKKQNKAILEFAFYHRCDWHYLNSTWVTKYFNEHIYIPNYEDILVTIIR